MNTLDNKLIIYDSNCKVCTSLRGWLIKLTSISENQIIAYKNLSGKHIHKVDSEKFKNAMALVDVNEGETIYGADGVAYIIGSQFRLLNLLLKVKIVKSLFAFLYKMLACNRYIIATPKSTIACDCFPDNVVKYRVCYIIITVSLSVVLTLLYGISLKSFFPGMDTFDAAIEMLLVAGSGWVIQILLAMLVLRKNALEYIGHLGSIMLAGLLVQVPWMFLHWIVGFNMEVLPISSLVISSVLMLYLHVHRIHYLQLSSWWTVSWFLGLQSTAIIWVYFFYIN